MNLTPTVAYGMWLPAPQGGRVLPWGGPAAKITPTVTHCVWLPAPQGGRILPWGGPAAKL